MKIRALMVPDPITIHKGADIGEAIELMKVNSIRHLPVISTDNDLVGFVTLADLKQGLIPSMVGDLSLEDSLKSFERGVALARVCQEALARAEQKVTMLSSTDPDAEPTPFDGD